MHRSPGLQKLDHARFSVGGGLVALGIVFGDIGTSPLYVIRAIAGNRPIAPELLLGGLSCVFWTLALITTFKYITLALSADNNGEGGIFALYALVRGGRARWVIFPAIVGCATLIADGFITPAISISSAVEGLRLYRPDIPTVPIVIGILALLFTFQQYGTNVVGRTFGPVMAVWFLMIGGLGLGQIVQHPGVLVAVNPAYGLHLLARYPGGLLILGAVFLCTTGAEALYSDLGHCGRKNIRVTWSFVKLCLLLSYFGQTAWVLALPTPTLAGANPFYNLMPDWFLPFGIAVATSATIIASQALISGVFTMVNEGMKLRVWPSLRVKYPTVSVGQVYIPFMNWLLLGGCCAVVLIFRESAHMEAAYGLAISVDMLMTTMLMTVLLHRRYGNPFAVLGFALLFTVVETAFFLANAHKFAHGGWFSFLVAAALFLIMYMMRRARLIRGRQMEIVPIADHLELLTAIQSDESIPKEADNLVYMAMSSDREYIDTNILHSILRGRPKRADVYWFLHVEITDEPYGNEYRVDTIVPGKCFFVLVRHGFKVEHKVNLMFRKIVAEMAKAGEVDAISHYPSLRKHKQPADFKFVLVSSRISVDLAFNPLDRLAIAVYRVIKRFSLPRETEFGLELTSLALEEVPIRVAPDTKMEMRRIE